MAWHRGSGGAWHALAIGTVLELVFAAGSAGQGPAGLEAKLAPGGGGTCVTGGSSSASNCPGWGGYIKPMPGTLCTMNVGNANPLEGYTNKIRNCQEAQDRKSGIAGDACDVINIIELNSDRQCDCACNPHNTCTLVSGGEVAVCIDDPLRPEYCRAQGYANEARCKLCQGCPPTPPPPNAPAPVPSCVAQAKVICDPALYLDPVCSDEPDKGCDCMCVRRSPCPLQAAGRCVTSPRFNAPAGCDTGNYATCQKCDVDGDGSYDWGSCTAHPPHCNSLLGIITVEGQLQRQICLAQCSTPILTQAVQFLADAKVRTISGDMNCDPRMLGCGAFGACPWIGQLESAGYKVCGNPGGTTTQGLCVVDFVLSNFCGCGTQTTRVPSPGDHSTIVFSSTPSSWTPAIVEVRSAVSGTTCPDPDPPNDNTSDRLGAYASCPTSENGHPVAGCSSWGLTSDAILRYYTRVDECYLQPEMGMPKVLVCDSATASTSVTCNGSSSAGATAYVTVGKAQINSASSCNAGPVTSSLSRHDEKGEVVTPSLVRRADGNLYFMVERDAHRDRQAMCNATLPAPCPAPPTSPSTSSVVRKVATAPLCPEAVALPQ